VVVGSAVVVVASVVGASSDPTEVVGAAVVGASVVGAPAVVGGSVVVGASVVGASVGAGSDCSMPTTVVVALAPAPDTAKPLRPRVNRAAAVMNTVAELREADLLMAQLSAPVG
jgi:hypothetical protein